MKDFEKAKEEVIKKNNKLLEKFEEYLTKQYLCKTTIASHINNIDLYINSFLVNYISYTDKDGNTKIADAIDGVVFELVDEYLGDFFIRKVLTSDEQEIKVNITSLRKFYTFLKQEGLITDIDLIDLIEGIRDYKDKWIRKINLYNDPDVDIEEIFDEF